MANCVVIYNLHIDVWWDKAYGGLPLPGAIFPVPGIGNNYLVY